MTIQEMDQAAQTLMTLFPGQPERHLRWLPGGTDGKKNVRELKSRTTPDLCRIHMAVQTGAGPGALGVMPGIRTGGIWRTPWAMLDFDRQKPADLKRYFEVLLAHNLTFTFNGGTTGRGTHVWFLLDKAITLRQAYRSLSFLKRVAESLGAEGIDLRPEKDSSTGSGIFLPYRGGGEDSFGVNPLVSGLTGEIIPLKELNLHPRQAVREFTRLAGLKSVERFLKGPSPVVMCPTYLPNLESVIGESQDRWKAELDRLGELWTEGRRHQLTLAATGYGVQQGIPHEQIMDDLLGIARDNDDEELEERRQTIQHSLDRIGTGELLAFLPFYEKAGVGRPGGPSAEVQALVLELLNAVMARPWKGKGGKTDRSLLKVLLELSWQHGYEHPQGVEISVAWSQLELDANIGSSDTLSRSIRCLEAHQWLRRGKTSQSTNSGSFILLTTNRSIHSMGGERMCVEYFGLAPHLRYGKGHLGKPSEQLIDLILWFGPQTVQELAERLESRPTDVRKKLTTLINDDIITLNGDLRTATLSITPNLKEQLNRRQEQDGSRKAREGQRSTHQVKRDQYVRFLERRRKTG